MMILYSEGLQRHHLLYNVLPELNRRMQATNYNWRLRSILKRCAWPTCIVSAFAGGPIIRHYTSDTIKFMQTDK